MTTNQEQNFVRFATALGMASFQAQSLEYSLVSLFAANSLLEPKSVHRIMDARYNHTLGQLVRDAAKELQLTAELTLDLEDALKVRNWLTHHFYREYGGVALSPSLLKEATERLETIWPMFEKIGDEIARLVIDQLAKSGKSESQIQDGINQALADYLIENDSKDLAP